MGYHDVYWPHYSSTIEVLLFKCNLYLWAFKWTILLRKYFFQDISRTFSDIVKFQDISRTWKKNLLFSRFSRFSRTRGNPVISLIYNLSIHSCPVLTRWLGAKDCDRVITGSRYKSEPRTAF